MQHIDFCREELGEYTDLPVQIPVDDPQADYLFLFNAGDMVSWPTSLIATAILFHVFGVSWTLSTRMGGYDGVNYGLFYDDLQLLRVANQHASAVGDLRVIVGECGHEHKTQMAITEPLISYSRRSVIDVFREGNPRISFS